MSDEYTSYLGDNLALDFVDTEFIEVNPEFIDSLVNTTELPNISNSTDSFNFTSIPDPDLSHIFGENLYPHNLATQMKFF